VAGVIVLDASVIIGLLDIDDAHARASADVLRDNMHDRLVAHRLTIAEALVHPAATGRGPRAAAHLEALGVEPVDDLDDPLALASLRADAGLRMPDCCVLSTAMRRKAALATFDGRLADAARGLGVAVLGA
jgi:predicted nucleic acid-binding protein